MDRLRALLLEDESNNANINEYLEALKQIPGAKGIIFISTILTKLQDICSFPFYALKCFCLRLGRRRERNEE